MKTSNAVITFSQSEKIKAGLIWATQAAQLLTQFEAAHQKGAQRIAKLLMELVLKDVHLIKRRSLQNEWEEAEKEIDLALVMTESGVPTESAYHLTRALSKVTSIGQRAMAVLKKEGLL